VDQPAGGKRSDLRSAQAGRVWVVYNHTRLEAGGLAEKNGAGWQKNAGWQNERRGQARLQSNPS